LETHINFNGKLQAVVASMHRYPRSPVEGPKKTSPKMQLEMGKRGKCNTLLDLVIQLEVKKVLFNESVLLQVHFNKN